MINLYQSDDSLILEVEGYLEPRHESQLAFLGFDFSGEDGCFKFNDSISPLFIRGLVDYFEKKNIDYILSADIQKTLRAQEEEVNEFIAAKQRGSNFKEGIFDSNEAKELSSFLEKNIKRPLKDHQIKAALHLLSSRNGANFSVPGSGKTAVVLSEIGRASCRERV